MKYYSEEETGELRRAFESEIVRWPRVDSRKMFGCPCYLANGRLFAFLVTGGLVITQLSQSDREELSRLRQTSAFHTGGKIYRSWVTVPVEDSGDLDEIMSFVSKSYEAALQKSSISRRSYQ